MKRLLPTATWVCASLWFLAWIALYLEAYRWHHLTMPLARGAAMPTYSRPGGFFVAVLGLSTVAPPLSVALWLWTRRRSHSGDVPVLAIRALLAPALIVCGIAIAGLGGLNHLVHDPRGAIDFDLTMRYGDGGFIVNGLVVAALGLVLLRRRVDTK